MEREAKSGDERVTLAPLDPEAALRALLKVDPQDPPLDRATADSNRDQGATGGA